MADTQLLTTIVKTEPFVLNDKCAEVYRNNILGTYTFVCFVCDKTLDSAATDGFFKHLDTHYYIEELDDHQFMEGNSQNEQTIPVESLKTEEEITNPVPEPHHHHHQTEFIDVNFPIATAVEKCSSDGRRISSEHHDMATANKVEQFQKKLNRLSGQFPCEICDKKFKYKYSLKEHYEIHLENRPMYKCSICDRKYSKRRTLMQHIKQQHGTHPDSMLAMSQYTLTSKSDLIEDLQEHANEPVENVATTDVVPSNNENDSSAITRNEEIDQRRKKTSKRARKYACEKCDKVFRCSSHLKEHYEIHLENRPVYECSICDCKYSKRRTLMQHIKQHETNTMQTMRMFENCICDICLNTFTSKFDLIEHLKEHRSENSVKTDVRSTNEQDHIPAITKNEVGQTPLNKISRAGQFPCDKCDKVFKYKSNLSEHYDCHLVNRPVYECDMCDKKYSRNGSLRKHKVAHHKKNLGDIENCICDICQNVFTSKFDLLEHLKEHTTTHTSLENSIKNDSSVTTAQTEVDPGKKKPKRKSRAGQFPCDKCTKVFKYNSNLKEHYDSHLENRPVHECDICSKIFNSIRNLRKHQKRHPEKLLPTSFTCSTCNETFINERRFHEHEKRHSMIFKCNVCDKVFEKKINLRYHMSVHDPSSKKHACNFCGMKFRLTQNLKTHIRRHTGEKPHECTICQKRFIHSTEMKAHVKRAHTGEKNFQCELCGREYFTSSALLAHTRQHNQDKAYKCQFCEDRFYNLTAQKDHERKHTGEKPYTCEVCQNSYRTRKLLRQHSILHTGTKPYACKYCDMKFAQTAGRRGHEKSKHGAL